MAGEMEQTVLELVKGQEGVIVTLGAMADVLNKMHTRLEKEDEMDEMKRKHDEEEEKEKTRNLEKSAMIKEVAEAVVKQLQELNGDKAQSVRSKTSWPMSANGPGEDQEKPVTVRSATDEVQKPIQNMDGKGDEYPMEEKKKGEVEELRKMVETLTTKYNDLEKSLDAKVAEETNKKLLKMGFREERGLMGPRASALGNDGVALIKSDDSAMSDPEKIMKSLEGMSYSKLRELEFKIKTGDTNGVPKELLG